MKHDAERIIAKVDELSEDRRLGKRARVWASHVYHFADVQNAASILRTGWLYSRARCVEEGLLRVDSADREVIAQSSSAHRYARLYFAPRTPTQYHMEGIRPESSRRNHAHCPVPIFLVFSSRRMLVRDDCRFSEGNMATEGTRVGSDAAFFRELAFHDIYHRGYYPRERHAELTHARHAEVLFEEAVDLADLEEIVCRSAPERDTLLHLLEDRRDAWVDRVRLERTDEGLFERRWYHVKEISLLRDTVKVELNRQCLESQRFEVLIDRDPQVHRIHPEGQGDGRLFVYRLPRAPGYRVRVRIHILDELAFVGDRSVRTLFES